MTFLSLSKCSTYLQICFKLIAEKLFQYSAIFTIHEPSSRVTPSLGEVNPGTEKLYWLMQILYKLLLTSYHSAIFCTISLEKLNSLHDLNGWKLQVRKNLNISCPFGMFFWSYSGQAHPVFIHIISAGYSVHLSHPASLIFQKNRLAVSPISKMMNESALYLSFLGSRIHFPEWGRHSGTWFQDWKYRRILEQFPRIRPNCWILEPGSRMTANHHKHFWQTW